MLATDVTSHRNPQVDRSQILERTLCSKLFAIPEPMESKTNMKTTGMSVMNSPASLIRPMAGAVGRDQIVLHVPGLADESGEQRLVLLGVAGDQINI